MDLKRFFCDEKIVGDTASLYGDEFFHAVKVTRHKVGYKLILCDNTDKDYYATVTDVKKDSLTAKIDEVKLNTVESDFFLTLFIGNNKDIDTVVQKAVELGVRKIVPFVSKHCNVPTVNKERLEKIVVESSKQCGRSILAEVTEAVTFDKALEIAGGCQNLAFYEFEKENTVKNAKLEKSLPTCIFIGCEGGFSEEEAEAFDNRGIKKYTLGKRILRVTTAVVAACTLVNENLDG